MAATMIPDDDLLAAADIVTVWVCSPEAPTDIWSLTEAIAWIMRQPGAHRMTLFRRPGAGVRSAWVGYAQIERLADALGVGPAYAA